MKYTIFYSWQSDLPNNTNRGFLNTVIEKTISQIHNSESYELEPSLDRDTQGIPGAPNISQTILDKIKKCDAFIADISIVTGDKNQGERPSPNPNVLLELGYAIALHGWDKIILFCNETHGTEEDLPFDIRQHRRINYTLKQDGTKSKTRKTLISQLKPRLAELLQMGKINSHVKEPLIAVKWNHLNLDQKDDPDEIYAHTKCISIPMASDLSRVKNEVEQKVTALAEVDGSIDPDWERRVDSCINKANEFIEKISDDNDLKNHLYGFKKEHFNPTTIAVSNTGNATATDIRIEINMPSWLLVFEDFPDKKDIPKEPYIPTPTPPQPRNMTSNSSINFNSPSLFGSRDFLDSRKRTSACLIKNRAIIFWADKLLHKHTTTIQKDSFYLIAKAGAPKGETILMGRAFCSEYNDWTEISLKITVQPPLSPFE